MRRPVISHRVARVAMTRVRRLRARRAQRRRHDVVRVDAPETSRRGKTSFVRFAACSLSCTAVDQLLAAALFSLLRGPLAGRGFVRILVSSVLARCVSLSLNYALNRRLVFAADAAEDAEGAHRASTRRESFPRFVALAMFVLALSTLGVYVAHTFLGIAEWKAKIVMDLALFFVNYVGQRTWVFRTEATLHMARH